MMRKTTIHPFMGNFFPRAADNAAAVAAFAYSSNDSDTFNLHQRFVVPQETEFPHALREIRSGRKVGHWSWYCLPVAPFILGGVERGSLMNRKFALRDRPPNDNVGWEAARAYLQFPTSSSGVNLRENYVLLMDAARGQLESSTPEESLWGILDAPKFRSSIKLFEKVSRNGVDKDVNELCLALIKIVGESINP